jgi:hypothetical protein
MEEKKNQKPEKLSYEELSKAASELHVQYQKLMVEYQKAMDALNNREFDYTSFFLQMLFKVLEHPSQYNKQFVSWAAKNVEAMLTSFAENMSEAAKAKAEAEGKGDAEKAE